MVSDPEPYISRIVAHREDAGSACGNGAAAVAPLLLERAGKRDAGDMEIGRASVAQCHDRLHHAQANLRLIGRDDFYNGCGITNQVGTGSE